MLNKNFILMRIKPYLNEKKEISEGEFFELFSELTLKEQYEVINIMIGQNIDLVNVKEEKKEVISVEKELVSIKDNYNDDYKKLTDLTNEQLCMMSKAGNKTAQAALIAKNQLFLYKIAQKIYHQYKKTCLTVDDLFQEGSIGLIEASEKFDITQNNKFLTYCWYWVRQKIIRAIINTGYIIRIPVHLYEQVVKVNSFRSKNPVATVDELIDIIKTELALKVDEVMFCLMLGELYLNPASLNTLVGEEEKSELIDYIPNEKEPTLEDIICTTMLRNDLDKLLGNLSWREAEVLRLRFGFIDDKPKTLEEIGKVFNVTRERIRQIEVKALTKLRHPLHSRKIESYLEEM